jgi:twitching motility protein PilT
VVPIQNLLETAMGQGASDLHLLSGDPPRVRLHGELKNLGTEPLGARALREALFSIMPERTRGEFEQRDTADFAHTVPGLARFRVNAYRHLGGIGAAFRIIPSTIVPLKDLGMPHAVEKLALHRQGLVLVTGKTGSGKSTTLAAILETINARIKGHIITIEDPVEHVHERKLCLISQREVGNHARGFAPALYSALREDPDVILIGELRDLETTQLAVTAGETGRLVFATLHTNGAAAAIERLINIFPLDKHSHVRGLLSTSLRGIICQQLLRRADGRGRVAAVELLINTPAVANIIREGRNDQLDGVIQTSASVGMQGMDESIRKLYERAIISPTEAYEAARNKPEFARSTGIKV